jgi:ElaB/YqjD/DUF883 family membrane-anchored ribosome-binding protein
MKAEKTFNELADQVDELLTLPDQHSSPEIDDLRSRIEGTLASAKLAIDHSSVSARLGRYATSLDHYVTGYPRLGFVTGLLLGGAIVHLAGLLHSED